MKFLKKNKIIIAILVLCVGFFALIGYTAKNNDMNMVGNGIGTVISPLQKFFYKVNIKIRDVGSFIFNFSDVKKKNEQLEKENNKLKNSLIEYENTKEENEKLKKMLDYTEDKSEYNYLCSDIVGIAGSSYIDGYIINKGTKDGIQKRMIAITDEGLVGQITSVGNNWSIIQTLGNENISVAAFNERSKETNGIVKGYRDGNEVLAKIETSNLESDIKNGDTIITSGLGGIYPKGISIGKIEKIIEDKGQFVKYGVIKPTVNMSKLEKVLIVVPKEERKVKY